MVKPGQSQLSKEKSKRMTSVDDAALTQAGDVS